MIGSFADIWCLAGGRDSLIAAAGDAWTSFDLGLGEDVADLGAVKEPNLEVLLAAEPDLILASVNTAANLELKDTFAQAGLNAAYFEVDCFEDYLRMLEICTRLTGLPERYETYGTAVRAQVDGAIARQDGGAPKVLYVRASGSSCKAKGSEGSVLGEMLAALGCVNIADSGGPEVPGRRPALEPRLGDSPGGAGRAVHHPGPQALQPEAQRPLGGSL